MAKIARKGKIAKRPRADKNKGKKHDQRAIGTFIALRHGRVFALDLYLRSFVPWVLQQYSRTRHLLALLFSGRFFGM